MKKPVIEVGNVTEEYLSDDAEVSDLDAYVAVDVTVDGNAYSVACCVGIEPSEKARARVGGSMTRYGGGPVAWWIDPADWDMLPNEREEDVLHGLNQAAGRLWRAVEELREKRR